MLTLLNDGEWAAWSDREIARACGVTHPFVARLRADLSGNDYQIARERTVSRGGTTYQQDTSRIGGGPALIEPASPAALAHEPQAAAPASVEPAPEEDPDWREIARLTPEAMIADILGLRSDLAEQKAQNEALRRERDDLKTRLREATADDQGAVIGSLQKQLQAAKFARDEAMASTKRMERRLKAAEARVKELESMEVTF